MKLVSQTIKNIIQGISQQPPILRHSEQLEEQINGYSTEAGGLQKRPPSRHIRQLPADIPENSKIHMINRDDTERYFMAFTGTGVRIFGIDGSEKTVNYEGNAQNYLTTSEPRENIKAVTVADYTFLINTSVTAQMNPTKTDNVWGQGRQGALVVVQSGQYGRTYKITLNGTEYSFTTPDGSEAEHSKQIATDYIANKLREVFGGIKKKFRDLTDAERNQFNITKNYMSYYYNGNYYRADDYFTLTTAVEGINFLNGSNWLQITGNVQHITVSDGFNNEGMKLFTTSAQSFSKLPANAPSGFLVLIKGETNSSDDYYVKYDGDKQIWKETLAPDITYAFNHETLPHIIRREANGTFTALEATWDDRKSGDDDSNPIPSFIGEKINDIFFFRNRLGIISGESVNLSKNGDFFNFFVDSATSIVDTDPIDLSVSHNKVSILYNAVPFNQDLYLFSNQTQFILKTTGVLSPKTAIIDQVTEFSADKQVKPIGVGRNLYFTSKGTDFTQVREYYAVSDSATQKDSNDITGHVPNLLTNPIYQLIACNNENMLGAFSSTKSDTMFVYKFLYNNDTKVQASWSEWVFNGIILGADFINSELYIVIKRGASIFLEVVSINYNTKDYSKEPYRIMLDRKTYASINGIFDSNEQTMTYDIRAHYNDTGVNRKYGMMLPNGEYFEGTDKIIIPHQSVARQDLEYYIGEPYEFKFKYSTFFIKRADATGTDTVQNDRLQLRNILINYADTGEFSVKVNGIGKPERIYTMTARYTGAVTNIVSKHPLETGEFRVPVMGKNTETEITVTNNSPLPSAFNSTTWQAMVTYRYKQV